MPKLYLPKSHYCCVSLHWGKSQDEENSSQLWMSAHVRERSLNCFVNYSLHKLE